MKQRPNWMTKDDFSLVNNVEIALNQQGNEKLIDKMNAEVMKAENHEDIIKICVNYSKIAEKSFNRQGQYWGYSHLVRLPKLVRRLLREERERKRLKEEKFLYDNTHTGNDVIDSLRWFIIVNGLCRKIFKEAAFFPDEIRHCEYSDIYKGKPFFMNTTYEYDVLNDDSVCVECCGFSKELKEKISDLVVWLN